MKTDCIKHVMLLDPVCEPSALVKHHIGALTKATDLLKIPAFGIPFGEFASEKLLTPAPAKDAVLKEIFEIFETSCATDAAWCSAVNAHSACIAIQNRWKFTCALIAYLRW